MDRPYPVREEIQSVVNDQRVVADGLVHLASFSQAEIHSEVRRMRAALLRGLPCADRFPPPDPRNVSDSRIYARLEWEHRIFVTSIEQLEWFFEIVCREDHGGNRQALGQYWKLLLEALGQHLEDEARLRASRPIRSP